jgi:glutamate dehydrogenase (NAD(P)+)
MKRFGRMQRRYDEIRGKHLVAAMESLTQKEMPDSLDREILRGASELDLVRSGLDDTMRMAFQELRELMKSYPNIRDYRTAAYAVAINKIAQSYYDLGLAEPPKQ